MDYDSKKIIFIIRIENENKIVIYPRVPDLEVITYSYEDVKKSEAVLKTLAEIGFMKTK